MQFTKKLPNYLAGIVTGVFVMSFVGTQYDLSIVSKAQAQATDEIIVTARKRSESIQDVPVAVSALSAAQLEKGNIPMTQDLGKLTPNVVLHDMAYAGAGLSASIRGLNYDDTEKSNDPAVGVTIDGVFAANNGGVNLDFLMLSQSKFCVVHREHFTVATLLVVLLISNVQSPQGNLAQNSKLVLKKTTHKICKPLLTFQLATMLV